MSTFAERQPGLYPTALRGRWGIAWGRAFGAQKDDVVTAAKDAVKSGFVAIAPADALPRHAADALLPMLPGESDTALRARVRGAWDFWPWAGTRTGLEVAIGLLGFTVYQLSTGYELGAPLWAQWVLVVTGTGVGPRTWGAPGQWGTGVWGSDASRELSRRVRSFLRLVSNARDIGWVAIATSTPAVWGAGKWGSGVWGSTVTRWRV